ncbi:MAG: hypothetical protein DRP65_05360 [Planctomycetota bacterium]|nr:MAG: hypothetical protein DRP65_05360 [Planctomycetota bacterium]
MKRFFLYIFLAGIGLCIVSCGQGRARPGGMAMDGIKVSDLEPVSAMKLPRQINFQVFTFEVPAESLPPPRELFLGLIKSPLRFTDDKAFEANGFFAGFGRSEMWDEIAARLARAGARSRGTNSLIVFDDKGDDIIFTALGAEQPVFYTSGDGKLAGVSLGGGQLAWRLKARPVEQLRGACKVEIQPVFKRFVDNTISRLLGRQESNETVFDVAGFGLTMSSGDFVLIGPSQYKQTDITLGSLFFASRGDFAFPIARQDERGEEIQGKGAYTLRKDVQLIRLFLVACTRVSD